MARTLPQGLAACIFCGGKPTTWEHVWPRWSHRYLTKDKRKWHARHAVEYRDRFEQRIVKHGGDPHDWQVKCVDEQCNNGWMRRLENAARPIMIPLLRGDDNRRYLGKKEQTILAAWIALKTMIQEHEPLGDRISHPLQLRRMWKKQLAPSRTWRIWIGRYDVLGASRLWTSYPMLLIPNSVARRRKSDAATYYNSQVATYVIGKLFIHLLRTPHQNLVRQWRFHRSVAPKLCQLWPLTGFDVVWPPNPLTDIEAGYVRDAIREFAREAALRSTRS